MKNSSTKRRSSFFFKLLILAGCGLGIYLFFVSESHPAELTSYFAIQSGLFCACYFALLLIIELFSRGGKQSGLYAAIKGMCTMNALFTCAVVYFCLSNRTLPHVLKADLDVDAGGLARVLLYYFTPLATLTDYFMHDAKGNFRWYFPLVWMLFPMLYPVYTAVYTASGGVFTTSAGISEYPYFFLNSDVLGIWGVAKWIVILTAGFCAASWTLVGIDSFLWKLKRKKKQKRTF